MSKNILCSVSTRGRYDTTLPLTILSIINQTKVPDKLVIFDDNDKPEDLRKKQHYQYLFNMLDEKNIEWEVIFGQRKGQHYNHQMANTMGYKWVWRLDDDTVAEPNTLETLYSYVTPDIGAVGGSILTPPMFDFEIEPTGLIDNIDVEPNIQWNYIDTVKKVDHLHCSFLYRAGVYDYNLSLSPRAFREETLFTYGLIQKGFINIVVPNAVTWHLKNNTGGIRSEILKYSQI
jgi:glycosyltransferase involved in cell wall biosynthesis